MDNSQLTIDNRQSKMPRGTLLQLEKHQICGFIHGSICPICKNPNIFYRSWRKDYLCGECFKVYKIFKGKVHLLGNQEDMD